MKSRSLIALALVIATAPAARAATIQSPSEFLGMTVGADKTLADYRQILAYFKALDAASPRVELEMLGKTTLGEDLFMAVISSETNIANKKRLQEIAQKIADPRGLSRGRRRGARARGQGVPADHLQHPLDRDRRLADGDGVGARARDRGGRARPSAASTRWWCCCCRRSTPTAR